MLVLDKIFGRGLETAGSSCFPHGNTLQAVKSRWKRSAWREWSAPHAANPRIRGCELLTLCYELFALNRYPPNPGKAFPPGRGHARCQLSLFGEGLWGNLLVLPERMLHSLCSLKTREPCAPFSCAAGHSWCLREIIVPHLSLPKITGRHLRTQEEEWFLYPHSLPSSVTPWEFTSGDAAVQSAPSWAAGLEPPSNSIEGALGQKEIVVKFREGLSTLRHSVHGFGRALCISSNA